MISIFRSASSKSNYELSIVPRSPFAADGTILHCSAKSNQMDIFEKMSSAEISDVTPPDKPQPNQYSELLFH